MASSGLRVSLVGLGCNNFGRRIDYAASRPVVHKALDLGITLFDTADVYRSAIGGSEEFLGQRAGPAAQGHRAGDQGRHADGATAARGASRRTIIAGVEASLRRLNTDWIDLYQQHQPDPLTPIEETLRAFDDLVRQGKVRYIGCSNLKAWQVVEARWTSRSLGLAPFVSCQNEYSLLMRRADQRADPDDAGLRHGPAAVLSAGERRADRQVPAQHADAGRRAPDRAWRTLRRPVPQRCELARSSSGWRRSPKQRGRTLLELAFSWLAARPCVSSIIAGATKPEQLADNVRATGCMLTSDELREIDRITTTE